MLPQRRLHPNPQTPPCVTLNGKMEFAGTIKLRAVGQEEFLDLTARPNAITRILEVKAGGRGVMAREGHAAKMQSVRHDGKEATASEGGRRALAKESSSPLQVGELGEMQGNAASLM